MKTRRAGRITTMVSPSHKYDPVMKLIAKVLKIDHVLAREKVKVTVQYKEHTELLNQLKALVRPRHNDGLSDEEQSVGNNGEDSDSQMDRQRSEANDDLMDNDGSPPSPQNSHQHCLFQSPQ